MDATTETSLGFSDIQLWYREADREQKNYNNLSIEQKESYKWIKASGERKKHPAGRAGGEVALERPFRYAITIGLP